MNDHDTLSKQTTLHLSFCIITFIIKYCRDYISFYGVPKFACKRLQRSEAASPRVVSSSYFPIDYPLTYKVILLAAI